MTSHTPGPWKVSRRFDIYEDTQKPGVGGTYIGTNRGNNPLPESVNLKCEADARLISAAPELLTACRDLIDAMDRYESIVDEARTVEHKQLMLRAMAVVEKATGASVRRYLCERCGGTGQQEAGCWSGKAYDAPAGTCQTCDGEGYLGPIPPEQLSTEDSMK